MIVYVFMWVACDPLSICVFPLGFLSFVQP